AETPTPGPPASAKARSNPPRAPSPGRPTTPGDRWTPEGVEEILRRTPQGRKTLAVEQRHDVGVFPAERNPTSFDPEHNLAHIAEHMSPEEAALGHVH